MKPNLNNIYLDSLDETLSRDFNKTKNEIVKLVGFDFENEIQEFNGTLYYGIYRAIHEIKK